MSFQTELFGTEKPIIGLLHLKPLPGDPLYYPGGAIASVADAAKRRPRGAAGGRRRRGPGRSGGATSASCPASSSTPPASIRPISAALASRRSGATASRSTRRAALGGGACASWEELVQRVGEGKLIAPDPNVHELYRERRKMFDALYERNREDMHRL